MDLGLFMIQIESIINYEVLDDFENSYSIVCRPKSLSVFVNQNPF